ncbi:ArsA-related P-loop ATPase [Planctomycetota bacterium]
MRVILFTGKGGVGKTTIAAATATRAAELGHKTLSSALMPLTAWATVLTGS